MLTCVCLTFTFESNSICFLCGRSRLPKLEYCYFRTRVEPNAKQVTHSPADVHIPIPGQFNLARNIALVGHRQQRRWQERRLALAAMCVAGKNPALVASPDGAIRGIGVMAEPN